MKPPKSGSRDQGTKPFTTQSQLKDVFQVERLLNRLSQHDPAKDSLQKVEISPLAKELAQGKTIARLKPQQATSSPRPNRPKEDFISYQREVAASQLTGEASPAPPQAIPKITGGFRIDAPEPSLSALSTVEAEAAPSPVAPSPTPQPDENPSIFQMDSPKFDPYH